jgi:hypothetical protein
LRPMFTRLLLILCLVCPIAYAAETPPSEASIKQLLEVTHAHQLLDNMTSQLDGIMKNAMQQVTQGQPAPPEVQKSFDQCHAEVMAAFKEQFTWHKLEPMYVRIYQKSFNQQEVDGMIAFYKTPTGQAMINKMPAVMQNSMNETMQMMGPMMQRIERMQQEMVAEMQASKNEKSG